jgi:unsaturated chondroitin disaccharide hydrolase
VPCDGTPTSVGPVPAAYNIEMHDPDSCLDLVIGKIDALADRVALSFPSGSSQNRRYDAAGNFEWTPGFWLGMLWLAYEYTGDSKYRDLAEAHLPSFRERLDRGDVHTHDLGFLYTLSCVAGYKLTGNENAKGAALRAADLLALRYFEDGRIVQAWGRLDDPEQRGRIIIDSVMNMPLLFWAGETTGDDNYGRIARNHLDQVVRHLVRGDGSTAHSCYVDPQTGERLSTRTHQGLSDDSCWSRGQAWGSMVFRSATDIRGSGGLETWARS